MKDVKIICDRCGKVTENNSAWKRKIGLVKIPLFRIRLTKDWTVTPLFKPDLADVIDLCEACRRDLDRWLGV